MHNVPGATYPEGQVGNRKSVQGAPLLHPRVHHRRQHGRIDLTIRRNEHLGAAAQRHQDLAWSCRECSGGAAGITAQGFLTPSGWLVTPEDDGGALQQAAVKLLCIHHQVSLHPGVRERRGNGESLDDHVPGAEPDLRLERRRLDPLRDRIGKHSGHHRAGWHRQAHEPVRDAAQRLPGTAHVPQSALRHVGVRARHVGGQRVAYLREQTTASIQAGQRTAQLSRGRVRVQLFQLTAGGGQ